jgi:hypothetical protein
MITLEIPEKTPSLNRLMRAHWSNRHPQREYWQWLVREARLTAKLSPPQAPSKVRVTITRYGSKILDHDNLVGGAKLLVDALVREGFAKDDRPEHMETIYFQHVLKPHGMTVSIQPLE